MAKASKRRWAYHRQISNSVIFFLLFTKARRFDAEHLTSNPDETQTFEFRTPQKRKKPRICEAFLFMGGAGFEPTYPEERRFTVSRIWPLCHPPKRKKCCWRKELNPQPSDYKSGALPLSYASKVSKQLSKSTGLHSRMFFYFLFFIGDFIYENPSIFQMKMEEKYYSV